MCCKVFEGIMEVTRTNVIMAVQERALHGFVNFPDKQIGDKEGILCLSFVFLLYHYRLLRQIETQSKKSQQCKTHKSCSRVHKY